MPANTFRNCAIQQESLRSIVSSSNATCQNGEDGSATASGSGGTLPYSYLWMPGGATTASVNNLSPGTYTVEVLTMSDVLIMNNRNRF
ncbi:MAG: SprB repeat-containing protein [Bacteroidetes bacterium]|nr:SprB repeat-containing protein [Bacteroidota bacterium]